MTSEQCIALMAAVIHAGRLSGSTFETEGNYESHRIREPAHDSENCRCAEEAVQLFKKVTQAATGWLNRT